MTPGGFRSPLTIGESGCEAHRFPLSHVVPIPHRGDTTLIVMSNYYFVSESVKDVNSVRVALEGWCRVDERTEPVQRFSDASRMLVPCDKDASFSDAAKVLTVIIETTKDDTWVHRPYKAPKGTDFLAAFPVNEPLNGSDKGSTLADAYNIKGEAPDHALVFARDRITINVSGVDMAFRCQVRGKMSEKHFAYRDAARAKYRKADEMPPGLAANRTELEYSLGYSEVQKIRSGDMQADILIPIDHDVHRLLEKHKGSIEDAEAALVDALADSSMASGDTYFLSRNGDYFWVCLPSRRRAAIPVEDDALTRALAGVK